MSSRALLYREDGALRAPWRLIAFAAVALMAMWTLQWIAGVVRPFTDVPPGDLRILMASFTILAVALLIAHAVMVRLVDRRSWSDVGLGREHVEPKPLLIHSAVGAAAILLPSAVLLLAGWLRIEASPGGSGEWLMFALGTLALLGPAALWEELLFRGYPFAVLRESIGVKGTVVVTSALFAVLHVGNPAVAPLPVVVVFVAGLWLAAVLLVTGSVVAAWVAHLAWNWALVGLLHAPVSGFRVPPPAYRTVDAGPSWATGGGWGPEGGVLSALCLAVLSWYLFRLWTNRREIAA